MVTSQLATRTLPEKKPVEVSVHVTPTVEIRSASDHLTAVAGLVSVSGAGSDRQWDEAPQCGDRSELRRKVIHRSGRPSGTVIRRVIDDDTLMRAITLAGEVDNDDLREILPALQEFTQAVANFLVAAGGDVEPAMQSLAEKARAAEKLAIDMREDRGQHLTDGRSQTPLGRLRRLAEGVVRDVSRLIEAATVTAAAQQYTQQTEPSTLAALGSGQAKHLMITPRPGTREALGAGQLYPDTVSTADRMQLALPASKSGAAPFTKLTLTGVQPPVLDVLAIGGGHGGVNATFEPDSLQESAFSKDYWKKVVVGPFGGQGREGGSHRPGRLPDRVDDRRVRPVVLGSREDHREHVLDQSEGDDTRDLGGGARQGERGKAGDHRAPGSGGCPERRPGVGRRIVQQDQERTVR